MEIKELKKVIKEKIEIAGDNLIDEVQLRVNLMKDGDEDCFEYENLSITFTTFIGVLGSLAACEALEYEEDK